MVVVLAAVCAYRYHRKLQEDEQSDEQVPKQGEQQNLQTQSSSIERTLSEQWQRTEPLRRTSSDILQRALSCASFQQDDTQQQIIQDEEEPLKLIRPQKSPRRRRKRHVHLSKQIVGTSSTEAMSAASTFSENVHVRQAWIDAVFGKDFYQLDDYIPPQMGEGVLKGLDPYVTYKCNIPVSADAKVGLTLAKLALGLYVRHVEPHSEAQSAGVQEGSILVSINRDMHMLGEPSRQALERIWQYEGHFEDTSVATKKSEPFLLTLLHPRGNLYTAVLFRTPFGISWAPCGHFGMVQRSYAAAAAAGVRRGSLVAAIHDKSLRQLVDHVDWGMHLKELSHQENISSIDMVLCYTPGASRPNHYERQSQLNSPDASTLRKKSDLPGTRTDDGIEVRVHPLDYSIKSLFQGNNNNNNNAVSSPRRDQAEEPSESSITKLAWQVVAGKTAAPVRRQEQRHVVRHVKDRMYGSCPPFPGLSQWDALDTLVHCLRFHQANYHDGVAPEELSSLEILERIGEETCDPFLLQCISMLCKGEAEDDAFVATNGESLLDILLSNARKDEDFCLRLYFLLRSFAGTLENESAEQIQLASQRLTKQMLNDPTLVAVSSPKRSGDENSLSSAQEKEMPPPVPSEKKPGRKTSYPFQRTTPKKKTVMRIFKKKKKKKTSESKSIALSKSPSVQTNEMPSSDSVPQVASSSSSQTELYPMPTLLDNTTRFFAELDNICDTIEGSLLKSFSQKIADWALQPWSASKETALAKLTDGMRRILASKLLPQMPLVNPIESSEVLVSVDPKECYILPSAHFPLLLTMTVDNLEPVADTMLHNKVLGEERIYRTRMEVVGLQGAAENDRGGRSYFVQAAVAGVVKESGRSVSKATKLLTHGWEKGNVLTFDTRSSWGAPQTLSLSLSGDDSNSAGNDQAAHADDKGTLYNDSNELGHCWVDLKPMWNRRDSKTKASTVVCHVQVCSIGTESFADDGSVSPLPVPERFELELKVTTELLEFDDVASGLQPRKRMLLYKHDDDLRQEMFAIDFIKTADALLKASGLDLKLLTFRCIPVGAQRGFIEWVPGSVPMSDLCTPFGSLEGNKANVNRSDGENGDEQSLSEVAQAGLIKYQSLHRVRSSQKTGSKNPIQDFLRSVAYDPDALYLIRKEVMDTYIKSCAGYCVLTYILGVGDRHLDNLLLHQTGHFFHCDFSFILGCDPKKYLPMRITKAMLQGMGGKESDGYALFVSLAGAAFCALRRSENVRVLLSLVRLMAPAGLPDVSKNQTVDEAVLSMRERLRLDLSDAEAIAYMEDLIGTAISSKIWMAVDAIHSLGKRF